MTKSEFLGHPVFMHPDGQKCVWLGPDTGWFIPYDVGGEGVACEQEHPGDDHATRAQLDQMPTIQCKCGRRIHIDQRGRDAKIEEYNEALRFVLSPEWLPWFEHFRPDLMDRLRAVVREKMP